MKKVIVSFVVITITVLFSACKKTENSVEPEQESAPLHKVNMAMVNNFAQTNLSRSGGWAWQVFANIIDKNKANGFYIATYSKGLFSDLFVNDLANKMAVAWSMPRFPAFFVNGVAQLDLNDVNMVNVSKEEAMVNVTVAAHAAKEVWANSNFSTSISGTVMTIETQTNFFKKIVGDVYLAVYLIEDKVKGYQKGHPDLGNALHRYVLRGAATIDGATAQAETFGYPLFAHNTTIPKGIEIKNKYTINIMGYDKNNLSVAAVLWAKTSNNKFVYINGFSNQQ